MGLAPSHIRTALENFRAAFGRIEQVQTPAGKPMLIALIKNPVGASETVRMLITRHSEPQEGETLPLTPPPLSAPSPPSPLHLLIAINDRYADGTDVSWLWDADFEPLEGHIASVIASGTRAGDMAVRLKYGTIAPEYITVEPELPRALDRALATLPDGETLFVLPTYTAMLELRDELSRRGWVRPFWET
jgi:UDP-N-acetylmuramyl tripeptide synthase